MKKNIYMVQASNTYAGNGFKAAYLPYAAGLLVAYAFTEKIIKENYDFKRFIFTREITDNAVESLENPSVVGFSNYIWNTRYNLVLAEKIKSKYPDCVIIFGGHNVPPDNSFLEKYPFIDFLVHAEGEEAYRSLLIELLKENPDYSVINNISYRTNESECFKTPTETLSKTDYPSPYLTGLFDKIFEENPDMQLDAILETSRGCPRSCAYCDWGCNSQKVKLYPIERIFAEIDWMAEHNVKFIWGADANFGAYDRDMEIVDYFISVREKTGCPERLRINYSMKDPQRVLDISRKLEKYGLSKEGATLSFQSLDPTVLENIGRKNMSMEKFTELNGLYKAEGITTYSELILGLPGETYESFCKGFGTLLAAGQHRLITVYNCELLPNSPMADPEYMKKHGIITAEIDSFLAHTAEDDEVIEKTTYVIGTNTMSVSEWINTNIFSTMTESYHHLGILMLISIFLFHERKIPYEVFYNRIIDFAKGNPYSIAGQAYSKLYEFYAAIARSESPKLYTNGLFGDLTWLPKKVSHLETIYRIDEFYDEIKPVLSEMFADDEMLEELILLQKTILKLPYKNNFSVDFNYDWKDYYLHTLTDKYSPLKKKRIRANINNSVHRDNWKDYAVESVWFGRNGITFNRNVTYEDI